MGDGAGGVARTLALGAKHMATVGKSHITHRNPNCTQSVVSSVTTLLLGRTKWATRLSRECQCVRVQLLEYTNSR
jgi:hypothetical protein